MFCKRCNQEKTQQEFYKRASSKTGYREWCKQCDNYASNLYKKQNKEKIKKQRQEYYELNKKAINEKHKQKTHTNINFKLAKVLRRRLCHAVRNNAKVGSAVDDLGCSIEDLKIYLESRFLPGMSWDNHGFDGWHIDHIKPLCSFDLTDREQLLKACHYTNLQPLWAKDNFTKSGKK